MYGSGLWGGTLSIAGTLTCYLPGTRPLFWWLPPGLVPGTLLASFLEHRPTCNLFHSCFGLKQHVCRSKNEGERKMKEAGFFRTVFGEHHSLLCYYAQSRLFVPTTIKSREIFLLAAASFFCWKPTRCSQSGVCAMFGLPAKTRCG